MMLRLWKAKLHVNAVINDRLTCTRLGRNLELIKHCVVSRVTLLGAILRGAIEIAIEVRRGIFGWAEKCVSELAYLVQAGDFVGKVCVLCASTQDALG